MKKLNTPNVLVIGGVPHDDSGILISCGKVYGIELERLSRVRHHCDVELLTYAYKENKVGWVYGRHALESQNKEVIDYLLRAGGISYSDLDYLEIKWAAIVNRLDYSGETSHHQNHAATAYYPSSLEESAVLVIDNFGSYRGDGSIMRETASIWFGTWNELFSRGIDFSPAFQFHYDKSARYDRHNSVGVFYQDLTIICGFNVQDGGKTMGLAPYGTDRILNMLRPFYDWDKDVDMPVFLRWYNAFLSELRTTYTDAFSYRADVAYAAQKILEFFVLLYCERVQRVVGGENLCIAGWIMLNSVANGLIAKESGFKNIFVQPAANDAGQALGRALAVYHSYMPDRLDFNNYYLGREYSDSDIENALRWFGDAVVVECYHDEDLLFKAIAKHLSSNRVVSCFWWRSEFWPRALGNRSILCNPVLPDIKDYLNKNVKYRESFRPFAPVVMEEFAPSFFDISTPSPHMLMVAGVKDERIPAVTHIDGTARLQTVTDEQNHRLYALLSCFLQLTGIPVLLNTSFNIKGRPIVETPEDALATFLDSNIDFLVLGNCIVSKK